MADDRDSELDERLAGPRLRLVKGGREEAAPGPGERAAGRDQRVEEERDGEVAETPGIGGARAGREGFEPDALDGRDREDLRDGIDVNRTDAEVEADARREDSSAMAGALRRDAAGHRQVAYTDETRAADFRDRADSGGPEAGADLARARWHQADAARQRHLAIADEHRADWYDADQHAASGEAAMPTPDDGSQPGARKAAVPPKETPVARTNRSRRSGPSRSRGERVD